MSREPTHGDEKHKHSGHESDELTYRQNVVAALERIAGDASTSQKQHARDEEFARRLERLQYRLERRKFGVDKAAVIGAYLALALLFVQDIFLGVSLQDARSAADHQYAAMSSQQRVMQGQLDEVQSQERAFVGVPELSIEWVSDTSAIGITSENPTKPKNFWFVRPIIENTGSTPSKNLRFVPVGTCAVNPVISGPRQITDGECGSKTVADDPADEAESVYDPWSKRVLLPHAKVVVGGLGVTPEGLRKMASQKLSWYIFGIIRYNDVFPKTREHVTKYCFVSKGYLGIDKKPFFNNCRHFNCADDECQTDRKAYDSELAAGTLEMTQ